MNQHDRNTIIKLLSGICNTSDDSETQWYLSEVGKLLPFADKIKLHLAYSKSPEQDGVKDVTEFLQVVSELRSKYSGG